MKKFNYKVEIVETSDEANDQLIAGLENALETFTNPAIKDDIGWELVSVAVHEVCNSFGQLYMRKHVMFLRQEKVAENA